MVACLAVVTVVVTWIAMRLIGLRMLDRSGILARGLGFATAPICMLAYGIAVLVIDGARHPHDDMPAMALAGSIMIALMMPAITIPMTLTMIRRARRRKIDA